MSDIRESLEEKQGPESGTAPEGAPSILPHEAPPSPDDARKPRRRPPSVFWPLVFVGGGVMLLLSNLGYLPWRSWNVLWRLWPLLLVALGIDLLIGRRSPLGAIVSALLLLMLIGGIVVIALFAQNIPILTEWAQPPELHTEHIEYPLTGVERARVTIDWTSVPGYLRALRDSPNLIEGDITYRGRLVFDVNVRRSQAEVKLDSRFSGFWWGRPELGGRSDRRWDVGLSPDVPLDLDLDAGSGPCDFELTGLRVSHFFLDAGSGPIELVLSSGSTFEAEIDGGSGPISIILPESVGTRVVLDSGSGPFRPDERFRLVKGRRRGDGVWETDNYRTAEHTILLEIDQGSGPISIR